MKSSYLPTTRKHVIVVSMGLFVTSIVVLFFLSPRAEAVNRTWDNGGGADQNWSNPLNWSGDTLPGSGDIAVFDAASGNSTIDGAFAGNVAGVQINVGFAGTITQAANLIVGTSGFTQNAGTFNASNGTLQVQGNFAVGATATFAANGGTLVFNGLGNQGFTLPASFTLNNLTVNKPTGTVLFFASGSTNLVIAGTLTLTDGGLQDNTTVSTFNAQGPVSIASTFDGGNGPLLISGAAARTITLPAGAGIPRTTVNAANVILDSSGAGTITFAQPFAVTNCTSFTNGSVNFNFTQAFTLGTTTNFTLGSGNVTFGSTYTQTGGNFSPGTGALAFNSNLLINAGTFTAPPNSMQLQAAFTVGATATFLHNGGTLVFTGNSNQALDLPASLTVNNVEVNKQGAVLFFNSGATNLVIAGTLTLTDGSIQDNTAVSTFNAQGPVSIAPTFDGGSGPLLISGAATRTITLPAGAGIPRTTVNAANVTLDTSGAGSITFAQPFAVTNCTSFTNGAVNFVFTQVFTYGTNTNFTHGSGNVTFNNSYSQTGGTFNPGTGNLTFNSNFSLTGGTFNAPSGTMALPGGFTLGAGATFVAGSGTLLFTGGSNQPIDAPSGTLNLNNLTVNKSGGSVLFFNSGAVNLVIQGTLTLIDGGLQDNTGVSTFNAQGNVSIASTFDGGSEPLSFTGTANQTYTNAGGVNPGGTWTINKPSGSVTLASNLVLGTSQTLNLTSGTLDLGPSFNLTSGPLTIGANGVLRNFGTGNITLGGNLSNSGLVNINGGGTGCSDPNLGDLLLIQSTDTNSRTWSGSGTFSLVDVEVDRQTVGATPGSIIAFGSSHLTNTAGFVLDAGCPVSITSHPTNQGGCPGGPVSFTVGASGTGLTFQWRKNSNNLNNGGNISGATTTTLTINPTAAGDVGSYDAVATSTLGITATSNAALLSLLAPPMITQSPSDATRCEGQSVTFMSSATGDGLTFQWRKNNNPIGGANLPSLTIPTVVAGDAGSYDVVVTGTCTPPVASAPAVLTVNTAPNITQQPANQTACENDNASFSVQATGTNLTFQWRKNNVPLVNNGHFTGVDTPTLSINQVVASDADTYDVVVSGTCSPSVASTARTLTVNAPTNITQQPTDQIACENDSASFSVQATGTNLTFQWRKNNVPLVNSSHVSGADTATLTINQVVTSDADTYDVVITGSCGQPITSTARSLTVNTPPAITTQPTDQTACETGTASFSVVATGSNLTFQWRKNNVPLVNSSHISGADTATLTINSVVLADADNYDVVVSGSCSPPVTSLSRTLTVNSGTGISQQPTDSTVCDGATATFTAASSDVTATVQWQVSTDGGANFTNVPGATSTTLSFTGAASLNNHKFRAVFNGVCSGATTNAATLTVNTAPAITQQPTDQIACETGTASFSVQATGSNLTFQWRKNTVPLVNNGHFTGVNTATLTINSVVLTDADNYDVVVSGSCSPSVTSLSRTLTVNTGTGISTQPTDNTVCDGAPATFTAASSDATATVQWQVSTDNGANFNNVPGATSTTLSFTAAASQNGHRFRAVFNGVCSGATTNAATLTVNAAPAITNQPTNQTVCDGGIATFTVNASGAGPVSTKRAQRKIRVLPVGVSSLTFQWRRNNQPLINGGNISGADTPTLTINPASAADVASYDVVVSSSCSPPATSNPVTLTVNGFALSASSQEFALAGGNGSVNVITAASCNWTAVSNDSFIHVTSGSTGMGNGTVNFSVDSAGAPRSGTLTIAGNTFTVNQTGAVTVAPVIISEFRFRGSAGALDEFIELYNNSDAAADISGYTVFALDAAGAQTLVITTPGTLGSNTTVIPARGHYLIANNSIGGYSLSVAPDQTYTADIVDGSSIGLFAGATPASDNRADAAGFDTRDALFFETAAVTPASGITTDGEYSLVRLFLTSNGQPQDTNNNAADFLLIATSGAVFNSRPSMLGAPGPQNLSSPIVRNSALPASFIDSLVAPASPPNRVRDLTPDPLNNSTNGTLTIRRRFTNNTGQNVTQLRFRIMNFTTFPSPGGGVADLRVRTSADTVVTITGGAMLTVRGTTLDGPAQPLGGGYNSTLSAGFITLGAPLAPGALIDVQFLLGVQTTGTFKFFVNVEALTNAVPPP